mmetsp:Transcript_13774/g.42877  ORF Transcript_13774/g.42877 Transcript_13774/m.42877 type:complete len:234 (+) Transcript_13774:812-1513(+)
MRRSVLVIRTDVVATRRLHNTESDRLSIEKRSGSKHSESRRDDKLSVPLDRKRLTTSSEEGTGASVLARSPSISSTPDGGCRSAPATAGGAASGLCAGTAVVPLTGLVDPSGRCTALYSVRPCRRFGGVKSPSWRAAARPGSSRLSAPAPAISAKSVPSAMSSCGRKLLAWLASSLLSVFARLLARRRWPRRRGPSASPEWTQPMKEGKKEKQEGTRERDRRCPRATNTGKPR